MTAGMKVVHSSPAFAAGCVLPPLIVPLIPSPSVPSSAMQKHSIRIREQLLLMQCFAVPRASEGKRGH